MTEDCKIEGMNKVTQLCVVIPRPSVFLGHSSLVINSAIVPEFDTLLIFASFELHSSRPLLCRPQTTIESPENQKDFSSLIHAMAQRLFYQVIPERVLTRCSANDRRVSGIL